MNFEQNEDGTYKTRGGYKAEIWKEINGYLVGVVTTCNGVEAVKWRGSGVVYRFDCTYDLIPKKRSIWVHKDFLTSHYCKEKPYNSDYIEFKQV